MQPLFALDEARQRDFASRILDWFVTAMRPLPWRETYEPYEVWVSEIMLQQTQMERGVACYRNWMRLFPDLRSVAEADEETVLKAWEGLGYYSRARNLHAAAKAVLERHGGVFPNEVASIRALPGIGEYTAGAIASIAYKQPVPAVDANVLRIFARICDIDVPVTQTGVREFVTGLVRSLLSGSDPRQMTQALMEFGALICNRNPRCQICPVNDYCEARRLGTVDKRPKKKTKVSYTYLEMATGLIRRDDRVFIQKRPPFGVWAGLWEFPGGCLEPGETPEEAVIREVLEETEVPVSVAAKIGVVRHGYTTCRVTMHGYFCTPLSDGEPVLHAATEGRWVGLDEIGLFAFPAGHRKLLESLGWV